MNTANHHHHPTVSFDEYAIVARSTEENLLGGEGIYSSLSKSDVRSPSMLQMAAATTNESTGHHGDGNAPPTQRGGANGVRKGRVIGKSKATEGEDQRQVKKRNSRIPVVRKAAATKSKPRGAVGSEVQGSKVNGSVQGIGKVSTRRGREGVARPPVNGAAALKTAVIGRTVTERSYSPPVPALAKKMKYQPKSFPEKDTLPHTQRNIKEDFIRSSSPPVPAVAKKLKNGQFESEDLTTEYTRVPVSPPVPALTNTIRNRSNVGLVHNTVTQPLYERTSSPPVPAVAKRLRDEAAPAASSRDRSVNEDTKRERSYDRALSPPVPTVAKKLQQGEPSKLKMAAPGKSQSGTNAPITRNGNSKPIEKLNSDPKIDCSPSHMILADGSEISINRPPSCKPDSKPLSPIATTTTNLPNVPMATAARHRDNQRGVVHPLQASNRQRLILQQLTMLKEGILTQQNDIDHRVENILTRNRQCNF